MDRREALAVRGPLADRGISSSAGQRRQRPVLESVHWLVLQSWESLELPLALQRGHSFFQALGLLAAALWVLRQERRGALGLVGQLVESLEISSVM